MSEVAEVTLDDIVDYGNSMMQMPKSALKVFQLALNDSTTNDQLAAAIEVDPAFTARLLQMVNSAAYSRGTEIVSIRGAVGRIGREQLAQLAAVLATASEVQKLDCDLLKFGSYWEHSLRVALICGELANRFRLEKDLVFVAGLLHDLGKPIEFHRLGDQMLEVLEVSLMDDDPELVLAEDEVLGFNHSTVGAEMATRWGLPAVAIEAIRYHHFPERAESYPTEVGVVALANAIEHIELDGDFEDTDHFLDIRDRVDAALFLEVEEAVQIQTLARARCTQMLSN
ncbi:MAG: HDOD domain-containing protein [Pseudomonadota bacterium]